MNFEDVKHTKESWDAFKTSGALDFPNLPYIIDGDIKLTESKAVTLFICEKYAPELLGATPAEKARVVMFQNVIADFFSSFVTCTFTSEDRNVAIDKAMSGIAPIVAALGSNDWLAGSGLTFVDFTLWEVCETINGLCQDTRLFTTHPTLKAHHERVGAIPEFAAYVASDKFFKSPFNPYPPVTKYPILPLE